MYNRLTSLQRLEPGGCGATTDDPRGDDGGAWCGRRGGRGRKIPSRRALVRGGLPHALSSDLPRTILLSARISHAMRPVPLLVRHHLERDDFSLNRHPALSFCWSMIFSEN